jgi:hypothetical protein
MHRSAQLSFFYNQRAKNLPKTLYYKRSQYLVSMKNTSSHLASETLRFPKNILPEPHSYFYDGRFDTKIMKLRPVRAEKIEISLVNGSNQILLNIELNKHAPYYTHS